MKLASSWAASQPEYVPGSKLMLDITEDEGGKRRRLPLMFPSRRKKG